MTETVYVQIVTPITKLSIIRIVDHKRRTLAGRSVIRIVDSDVSLADTPNQAESSAPYTTRAWQASMVHCRKHCSQSRGKEATRFLVQAILSQ